MGRRGTPENPASRFERIQVEPILDEELPEPRVATEYFRDASRSILVENDSPDLGFRWSLNPYRGCEHGCVYCYARPSHEYLGFRSGLDFESRILVKEDAPVLLRQAFMNPRWAPEMVSLSGNTDCYQPIEHRLRITRRCLEVFAEFRNPVAIVTKSAIVLRDLDLLGELARHDAVRVLVSVTTLDRQLADRLEPRAGRPEKRLEVIAGLAGAGIPVGALVAPVIPGLNDHEIPKILERVAGAGARTAAGILLRLPPPVDRLFEDWLGRHYPGKRKHVLERIRDCHGGKLNDPRFGSRMRGEGAYADQIAALFRTLAPRFGMERRFPPPSTAAFRRPAAVEAQGKLF